MSLDLDDARAVADVLSYLADAFTYDGTKVREPRFIDAMAHLAKEAGYHIPFEDLPWSFISRTIERLKAADSDGAAQAVCRALDEHSRHGGRIPWPSILKPFMAWQDANAGLRDQTAAPS